MTREFILEEIRKAAAGSGGVAPGQRQFESVTGIGSSQWRGKYWAKWSDAVTEAGLTPQRMIEANPDETVLGHLATLTRAKGRLPTYAELRMQRTLDKSFPDPSVFARLGAQQVRVARLRDFVSSIEAFNDVLAVLPDVIEGHSETVAEAPESEMLRDGFVYMLKLGKHYKVGMTTDVPRRHRQVALELPEKPTVVHSIRTDDPEGIEAYWHRRFAKKQTNGEWFALDAADLKAFKRRKFM